MANHFQQIGLHGADGQLQRWIDCMVGDKDAVETQRLSCGGQTLHWKDSSGAGVSLHFTDRSQLACATPFFDSQRSVPVLITERIPDGTCDFCDRLEVHVFDLNELQHANGNGTEAAYMLAAQVADIGMVSNTLSEPAGGWLRLSFFAETLNVWVSEDAYRASQSSDQPLIAARSLIPWGLFSVKRTAIAVMTGEVVGVSPRINQLTGQGFQVLDVSTYAATFEVVVATELLPPNGVTVGNTVSGQFWIVSRGIKTAVPGVCHDQAL